VKEKAASMVTPISGRGVVPGLAAPSPASTVTVFSQSAPVALPGSRCHVGGAGGPQLRRVCPDSPVRAVRGHRIPSASSYGVFRTSAANSTLSRAAVTGATSSRQLDPERPWRERVDGEGGAQSPSVCGPGPARLADTPAFVAVSALFFASAAGTAATIAPPLDRTLTSLRTPRPVLSSRLSSPPENGPTSSARATATKEKV
jgi:hypothetical protein